MATVARQASAETLSAGPTCPLLLAIVAMFSLKGGEILALPFVSLRIALPLVVFFVVMFLLAFASWRAIGVD